MTFGLLLPAPPDSGAGRAPHRRHAHQGGSARTRAYRGRGLKVKSHRATSRHCPRRAVRPAQSVSRSSSPGLGRAEQHQLDRSHYPTDKRKAAKGDQRDQQRAKAGISNGRRCRYCVPPCAG